MSQACFDWSTQIKLKNTRVCRTCECKLVCELYHTYIELASLRSTNSKGVIQKMKTIFVQQDIPEYLVSDNGLQFSSLEFQWFSGEYGFKHVTSNSNFP